jgi:hypothetical protein
MYGIGSTTSVMHLIFTGMLHISCVAASYLSTSWSRSGQKRMGAKRWQIIQVRMHVCNALGLLARGLARAHLSCSLRPLSFSLRTPSLTLPWSPAGTLCHRSNCPQSKAVST